MSKLSAADKQAQAWLERLKAKDEEIAALRAQVVALTARVNELKWEGVPSGSLIQLPTSTI